MVSMKDILLLGTIQGITEFLPVSSSGHLALFFRILGTEFNLPLAVAAHAGTLIALILYFRKQIVSMIAPILSPAPQYEKKEAIYACTLILIGSIPAVIAGILLEKKISALSKPLFLGIFWIVNGTILILGETRARKVARRENNKTIALVTGIMQAFAIIPGLSRAGLTITASRNGGLSEQESFEFSFLLGIVIIAGSFVYELIQHPCILSNESFAIAAISGVSGYGALHLLWKFFRKGYLQWFGVYTTILGVATLLLTGKFL